MKVKIQYLNRSNNIQEDVIDINSTLLFSAGRVTNCITILDEIYTYLSIGESLLSAEIISL